MSHMDTFNFKCNESAVAWQNRYEILVRERASFIKYENVEKYDRVNVSDVSNLKNIL